MKIVSVKDEVLEALARDGECIVRYPTRHTTPEKLEKDDVILLQRRVSPLKSLMVMVVEKEMIDSRANPEDSGVEMRFKKVAIAAV